MIGTLLVNRGWDLWGVTSHVVAIGYNTAFSAGFGFRYAKPQKKIRLRFEPISLFLIIIELIFYNSAYFVEYNNKFKKRIFNQTYMIVDRVQKSSTNFLKKESYHFSFLQNKKENQIIQKFLIFIYSEWIKILIIWIECRNL